MMVMQVTGNPRVFIPMHRGAGGFMSDEQFETVLLADVQAPSCSPSSRPAACPMPLFEGDYTPRLKYLAELPARQGGRSLRQGRPREVQGDPRRQHVLLGQRAGLRCCAPARRSRSKTTSRSWSSCSATRGALMLDSGLGVPDEARPENMLRAARGGRRVRRVLRPALAHLSDARSQARGGRGVSPARPAGVMARVCGPSPRPCSRLSLRRPPAARSRCTPRGRPVRPRRLRPRRPRGRRTPSRR